jgi:hypothetical protein
MASWSTGQKVLFAFAIALIPGVVKLLGDQYLAPLPMWLQLVIAAAGICSIATIAIYSRRRARRSAPAG